MRKVQFYVFSLLLFFGTSTAFAQQDAQFSHYMFNTLYYNPGYAGVEGVTKISLLHRTQWLGYTSTFDPGGAPNTQVLTLTSPILRLRSGFGFHIVNDDLGPLNNLELQGSFAYHLGIDDSKLSFGIKFGVFSQSIDYDQYRALDQDDPFLEGRSGRESQVRPDLALGVFYRAEKYYGGLSFNHLLKSEFDFGFNDVRNAFENHAYLTFGYIHDVNFDVTVIPSFLVKTDFNQYNFIIGGIVNYKKTIMGGLSFRESEDINVLLGYNFLKDKSLSLSYAFSYVVKDQDAKQPTTHEVLLSYTLPFGAKIDQKIIRTPRFRQ